MAEVLKICCRTCHAKYDVSDLPPFTQFACPDCGTLLRTPKRFGRYLLEKLCSGGGNSEIYRAIDPMLARRVAVKILVDPGENNENLRRFPDAARLFARVTHPAVVPVYDCGREEEKEFVVMQFLDGGDLKQRLFAHTLPDVATRIAMLRTVAEGLGYLFSEHRIVHHDVKPSNILTDSEGEVKIADFDLADVRESGDSSPCPLWGSPAYLSPERLCTGGEDHRGDIYSLGVTIYEILTGSVPFDADGTTEELYQRRQKPFPPLLTKCPEAGMKIDALLNRMLSFDPAQRPGYPEIVGTLHL